MGNANSGLKTSKAITGSSRNMPATSAPKNGERNAIAPEPNVIYPCSAVLAKISAIIMPTAETLHCPSCGAAASVDSTKCSYCGARLATVACPSCFGMMFIGEKFCSHCGAVAQRTELPSSGKMLCPKCKAGMKSVQVGKNSLWECSSCDGMWVDAAVLQQICADKEQQSAVLGMPVDPPSPATLETNFHYIPCPVCQTLMNRINFARCSGVIIDVCKDHGTWFDKDELRRIVDFIRAGGLEKARARENAALEAEHERLLNAPNAGIPSGLQGADDWETRTTSSPGSAIIDIAGFLISLFK
jgi:Zn-finger nucleic acid-binding protein